MHLKSGCVVCNIGHFDNEIDVKYLKKTFEWYEVKPGVHKVIKSNGDYLILLGEGRLVNLALATGHPSRVMDGSFCNQVLAQIMLFKEAFANKEKDQRDIYVKVLPKKLMKKLLLLWLKGLEEQLQNLLKSKRTTLE